DAAVARRMAAHAGHALIQRAHVRVRRAAGAVGLGRIRAAPVDGIARTRVDVALVAAVAGHGAAACAGPTRAGVHRGARVAVVAGNGVVRVYAAGDRAAGVVRAQVAVVAVGRGAADAGAGRAGVAGGAGVAVVARSGVVRVDAAGGAVAR